MTHRPNHEAKNNPDQSIGTVFVQSKIAPLWPDGNWNRPRSASTLIVERVPSHSGRVS